MADKKPGFSVDELASRMGLTPMPREDILELDDADVVLEEDEVEELDLDALDLEEIIEAQPPTPPAVPKFKRKPYDVGRMPAPDKAQHAFARYFFSSFYESLDLKESVFVVREHHLNAQAIRNYHYASERADLIERLQTNPDRVIQEKLSQLSNSHHCTGSLDIRRLDDMNDVNPVTHEEMSTIPEDILIDAALGLEVTHPVYSIRNVQVILNEKKAESKRLEEEEGADLSGSYYLNPTSYKIVAQDKNPNKLFFTQRIPMSRYESYFRELLRDNPRIFFEELLEEKLAKRVEDKTANNGSTQMTVVAMQGRFFAKDGTELDDPRPQEIPPGSVLEYKHGRVKLGLSSDKTRVITVRDPSTGSSKQVEVDSEFWKIEDKELRRIAVEQRQKTRLHERVLGKDRDHAFRRNIIAQLQYLSDRPLDEIRNNPKMQDAIKNSQLPVFGGERYYRGFDNPDELLKIWGKSSEGTTKIWTPDRVALVYGYGRAQKLDDDLALTNEDIFRIIGRATELEVGLIRWYFPEVGSVLYPDNLDLRIDRKADFEMVYGARKHLEGMFADYDTLKAQSMHSREDNERMSAIAKEGKWLYEDVSTEVLSLFPQIQYGLETLLIDRVVVDPRDDLDLGITLSY